MLPKRFTWYVSMIAAVMLLSVVLYGCVKPVNKSNGEGYPNKPVQLIIAFTAGGSSDVQARIVEKYWKKYFNDQPLAFEYKPGAGGQVGFTEIARAVPDGYTIGGVNVPHILLQSLSPQATFCKDDFVHIAQVVNDPQLIVVNPNNPIRTLDDFIAEAKKKEGRMTVGIVGTFTAHHMALLKLQDILGVKFNAVPFQGSADQNVALLGGHIDAIIGNLNDIMRYTEQFRMLAIASENRHQWLPDVPTFQELGYSFTSDIRRGFSVPANTDPAIVQRLREGFQQICNDPEYLNEMEKIGQPAAYLSGEDFTKYCDRYYEEAKQLIDKYELNKKN
ncbi:tripartite tricarboxylate transporter substrate binding protein [Heliobacterium chlorum]|uniref:Tripartite tricarboxylate transporter substrate binding protein n=1 Tax=Heliobacterium chlorum TaxID=2698 RepID=A0ABR7T2D0_HELCL|nr:tripartite tricarboxylate transporter substrate binding protein [Heliobacterium chlorum]